MKTLLPVVLLTAIIAGIGGSGGQIGSLWSWDELAAKADAIVIAEHSGTVEAKRGVEHPNLKPSLPAVEMESVFKVLAVLKAGHGGEAASATTIRLTHYRVDMEEFQRRHGPLAGLVNAGSSLDFGREKGPYLLFLTRIENDLYQPLSGFTFPTRSVFLVRNVGR